MNQFEKIISELQSVPKTWLVTGTAGFIGSNILEVLLQSNQKVVGLDNFATGFQHNLDEVKECVGEKWNNFSFINGDVRDFDLCLKACKGVDYVLHQGALGSVPRSIEDPLLSNEVNVNGTLNIFKAAAENGIKRVVYASSSSVYGDDDSTPKVEEKVGNVLSPYAVTKKTNELYAQVCQQHYGIEIIGLRYFNVFGKRQNPNGAYAAVIPKWIQGLINNEEIFINGDGSTSRDFTYIQNVVELNILAATSHTQFSESTVFNGAIGATTNLNELFTHLKQILQEKFEYVADNNAVYRDFRKGDITHSFANVDKAKKLIGYSPKVKIEEGLRLAVEWYTKR